MNTDLHMHSTFSDGTDSPRDLLERIRAAGSETGSRIDIFSLTDHDDFRGCLEILPLLRSGDPLFIPGVEISAKKEKRKYHILGYAFDTSASSIRKLTEKTHSFRMEKLAIRLDFLKKEFGFEFPSEEIDTLYSLSNPGKPHLGNLMAKYGYAPSKNEAIANYINQCHTASSYASPEEAIDSILSSGGIPVLAHGIYGSGTQYLDEKELTSRIAYLKSLGLMGMECYYSRYTAADQALTSNLCSQYDLLATAGSDYHGTNKPVQIGENGLADAAADERVLAFIDLCKDKLPN